MAARGPVSRDMDCMCMHPTVSVSKVSEERWTNRLRARSSAGFACNLRDAMYCNVQTFSFSNI